MEIGLAHEKEGITYFDLVKELESQTNFKFGKESELTFLVWFSQNFRRSENELSQHDVAIYRHYLDQKNGDTISVERIRLADDIKTKLNFKYWLNGEASKQYLDYLELQESRKAATQAKRQSNISIGIAIFALLVSSVLGIYSMVTAPKPPYDVKVIEDKSRVEQLERENGKLKDELYKAEMMLEAYESYSANSGT